MGAGRGARLLVLIEMSPDAGKGFALECRKRCRVGLCFASVGDPDLVSSSAGSVLFVSVARKGATIAIGAPSKSKLARQQMTGLVWNEASDLRDRTSIRRITDRFHGEVKRKLLPLATSLLARYLPSNPVRGGFSVAFPHSDSISPAAMVSTKRAVACCLRPFSEGSLPSSACDVTIGVTTHRSDATVSNASRF